MHDFVKIVTNRCVFALLYLDEILVINNLTEISDLLNYSSVLDTINTELNGVWIFVA